MTKATSPSVCRRITVGCLLRTPRPCWRRSRLSDAQLAPIIYNLSHTETDGHRRFINYRDMSVQQLGSIYERLLEREPLRNDDGRVTIRPNPYARKDSGSFYTPQELVDLIVEPHLAAAGGGAPGTVRGHGGRRWGATTGPKPSASPS